jgi:hypothetical protein
MNQIFPTVYPSDGKFCVTCASKVVVAGEWECQRPNAPIDVVTALPRYTTCRFERSMSGACGNHGQYYTPHPDYIDQLRRQYPEAAPK